MSWSPCETSSNSKFGSRSALVNAETDLYTSVSVDVLDSWSIEFWFFKDVVGPCVLFCSSVPTMCLIVNRSGRYVMRLSGEHHIGKSCEISRISNEIVKNNQWNHVCVQYHGKSREYILCSNGSVLFTHKGSTVSQYSFDKIHIGSIGYDTSLVHSIPGRFYGNIDSVRISSCVRYKGSSYTVPEERFVPDAFTTTIQDFEEPVFIMDDSIAYTERNWNNTNLNKTYTGFMTGTQCLVVDSDTMFLPYLSTPGVDMNSMSWTIEFFFRVDKEFEGTRVILERGSLSIVLSVHSIRVLRGSRTICTIKSSVLFGEWNHLCLCHDSEKRSMYLGSNGSRKNTKGSPKIEMDNIITVGSIGTEPLYYDNFRMHRGSIYTKKYEIPSPIADRWSYREPGTVLYTSFEEPVFFSSNITSFSVLLSWEPVSTQGSLDKYTIYINGSRTKYETRDTYYNVYGLEPDTEYVCCIYNGEKKIHRGISIKTLKISKDNSFNVLSSIAKRGKYDVSVMPLDMVRNMDMGSIFDDRDHVIVPVQTSRIKTTNITAKFASVSSVVDASYSNALLVPFNESGQNIQLKETDGSITDVSFVDGEVEVDGKRMVPGGYVVVSGRKMRVGKI